MAGIGGREGDVTHGPILLFPADWWTTVAGQVVKIDAPVERALPWTLTYARISGS